MQPEAPIVTRRELRAAEARAHHRAPGRAGLPTLDGLRIAGRLAALADAAWRRATSGAPTGRALTGLRLAAARPGCVALLSAAFLAGGITQVTAEQHARDEHRAAVEAAAEEAARAQAAHVQRVTTASATRLTQGAVAYAAYQRDTALATAEAALAAAGAVTLTASPVVAAEQIGPLDAASAQLAELLAAIPASTDVIAPPSPRRLLHTAAVAPVPLAPATTSAAAASGDAPSGTTAALVAAERSGGAAARSADAASRGAGPAAPSYVVPGAPLSAAAGLPASAPAEPVVADPAAAVPVRATPLASPATVEALDLAVTAQVVAVTQQVAQLSAQVEATAAANIAAAQAAAEQAAAEQAAAAEAAARAAAQQRRVAAVRDGENGALPVDELCGVDFARGVLLRCDAAAALEGLNEAFRAEFGRDLRVVSSYRDLASQVSVKATRGGLAATPGTSNHGWGLAVDFDDFGSLGQFDRPTYRWMREHAGAYGWRHPSYMQPGGAGPAEPWHWEYGTTD